MLIIVTNQHEKCEDVGGLSWYPTVVHYQSNLSCANSRQPFFYKAESLSLTEHSVPANSYLAKEQLAWESGSEHVLN